MRDKMRTPELLRKTKYQAHAQHQAKHFEFKLVLRYLEVKKQCNPAVTDTGVAGRKTMR